MDYLVINKKIQEKIDKVLFLLRFNKNKKNNRIV